MRAMSMLLAVCVLRVTSPLQTEAVEATGGTVTHYMLDGTNVVAHLFKTVGTSTLAVAAGGNVEVLVVGGGGGGGETVGGGGGGGGVIFTNLSLAGPSNYTVIVGDGGAGGSGSGYPAGVRGQNSTMASVTAIGGGAGAGYDVAAAGTGGSAGGSGGGGGARALYTPGQGNDGGAGWSNNAAGGGGGASQTGIDGSSLNGGRGGDGVTNWITGAAAVYGGGGGGGTRHSTGPDPGAGGAGGGGSGGRATAGTNGLANTGGGGGGGGYVSDLPGGKGGAGIVVVRYLAPELVNAPVSDVLDTSAWLNGRLGSTGAVPYTVWVYWDTNNWTTNKTWGNGHEFGEFLITSLTWQATGLLSNATYYYTYYASNAMGELWAQPAEPFQTWGLPSADSGGGATGVGIKRATLQGKLFDGVGAYATLYWWTSEATVSNSASLGWITEGQSFATQATGLVDDTAYFYRCFVSNAYGMGWSDVATFSTPFFDGSYYVATNGPAGGNGTSWVQAMTNLQTAMNEASPGDTIRLAAHTFSNSTPQSNCQYLWTNKPLTIVGGYAANPDAPDALTNRPTILTRGAAAARILYVSGVTNATLRGVTLAGGTGGASGAGLYVTASSNLMIASCVISNNANSTSENAGSVAGGIYVGNSAVAFTNCVVTLNTLYRTGRHYGAAYGGGLYAENSTVSLGDCLVDRNWADGRASLTGDPQAGGGGVYLASGRLDVSNSVIRENKAYRDGFTHGQGGGIYVAGGSLTVWNTLLHGNVAGMPGNGYGLRVKSGAVSLNNCTVAAHVGDALNRAGGSLALTNSIVWGNSDDIVGAVSLGYCDIKDGDGSGSNGCFSADPLFQAGYYLDAASPCVNTGSMTAAQAGLSQRTTRVDGQPDDGMVDLGYHYPLAVAQLIADLYVAPDGDDILNAGTNALTPFRTVTKALATATDDTRIHIAAGSYTNGSETFPLTVSGRSGVQLLGADCATTIINANGSGKRVLALGNASGATRLEGLTFTGGQPDAGGLSIVSCGEVSLVSCVISGNRRYAGSGVVSAGGGLYVQESSVRLTNTLVALNTVYGYGYAAHSYGGGIYLQNSSLFLANCRVEGNASTTSETGYGGGIHMASGSLAISNSVIRGNTVKHYGGGVSAAGGTLTLVNVLVLSNQSAGANSDGIYAGGLSASFINCTVVTNYAVGIRCAAGTVAMTNCIVWGHASADLAAWPSAGGVLQNVGYSLLGGPPEMHNVNGCLVGNPRFAGPLTNDFRLLLRSPAVNRGYTFPWMAASADLDGNPRLIGKVVDMGAYEFQTPIFVGTVIILQ